MLQNWQTYVPSSLIVTVSNLDKVIDIAGWGWGIGLIQIDRNFDSQHPDWPWGCI